MEGVQEDSLPFQYSKQFKKNEDQVFFQCLIDFSMEVIWFWTFLCREYLLGSVLVIHLLRFMSSCMCSETSLFPNIPIYWYKATILMILLMSMVFITSPFIISNFINLGLLPILIGQANDLSILFTFSEVQLFILLILRITFGFNFVYFYVIFISILF